MVQTQYYSEQEGTKKPMPKLLKIMLLVLAGLFLAAFGWGQYIANFYLVKFDKLYAAQEDIIIYAEPNPTAAQLGQLPLWQKVMVPRDEPGDFAEVDKPVHGYVQKSLLSDFDKMNLARVARGLPAKQF